MIHEPRGDGSPAYFSTEEWKRFFQTADSQPILPKSRLRHLQIPVMLMFAAKKKATKAVDFLSEEGLKTLLIQPDTSKRVGIRTQCFTCLMYDTAARCQELLDSRLKDFSLAGNAPFVYLNGKGNKTRAVPLMKTTVDHLLNCLEIFHPDHKNQMDNYLFYTTSHGGRHLMSRDTM